MPPNEDLTDVLLDGRYRLTRLMGAGGMGQVYEGMHETLDRKVAVKVLLPRLAYEPKFRERFLREAKAASKVRHPNVVQILDFGDTPGGSVYFAMEFLDGRDLQALLREEGRLQWPRARDFLLQMSAALAAAHERKIIHRDIKPANFFITEERGQELVKVLDFGIAKLVTDGGKDDSSLAESLTGTGEVFGTAKYMAPEQAHGASDDPRVDVYSLGVVAYEMLTGQVPFTGTSVFQIITRHVNEPPRPPHELVPEIPAAVEALILRALAKRPADRFVSMEEMERVLASISTELDGVASAYPPSGAWVMPTSAVAPVPAVVPTPVAEIAVPPSEQVTAEQAAGSPLARLTIPALVQPRSVVSSEQVTAARGRSLSPRRRTIPAHGHPQPVVADEPSAPSPGPAAGSSTSVFPTRLKVPSSIASGELVSARRTTTAVAPGPAVVPLPQLGAGAGAKSLPKIIPRGADESEPGAATARTQGASDAASATGPQDSRTWAGGSSETDSHALFVSPPSAMRRGAVLGLVGTVGGGALVFAGFFALSSRAPDEPAAGPSTVVQKIAPHEPAAPGVAGPQLETLPSESVSTGAAAALNPLTETPAEEPSSAAAPGPSTSKPPASKPPASKPPVVAKPTKASQPLTDAKAKSQLVRALKKKCGGLGAGTKPTVTLVVGSDGRVLSKSVRGASSELAACLVAGAEKAEFPAGKTRSLPIEIAL